MAVALAWSTHAFVSAFSMVCVGELFDKTWFVAFLMALKYDKLVVFWASLLALIAHALIAVLIGLSINKFFSISTLNFGAMLLYALFALMYAKDAYNADPDADIIESGTAEAEKDAGGKLGEAKQGEAPGSTELGEVVGAAQEAEATSAELGEAGRTRAGGALQKVKVFMTCWMTVFLAEWGDRTQITMIGLQASQPAVPVCVGSSAAFFLLTLSAVLSGKLLSGTRLSERKVYAAASLVFVIFAVIALEDAISSKQP